MHDLVDTCAASLDDDAQPIRELVVWWRSADTGARAAGVQGRARVTIVADPVIGGGERATVDAHPARVCWVAVALRVACAANQAGTGDLLCQAATRAVTQVVRAREPVVEV